MILFMKRIMLAALVFAASAPALAAERRHSVTDFDRVSVEGPYPVTLATGKAPSAIVTGSPQALDRVSVSVQGRTLRIRPNRSAWGGYPGEGAGPVTIALTGHDLRGVTVIGSGSLTVDKARNLKFDVALSGSGRLTVGALEADVVSVGLIGGGTIALGGRAKTLRATVQGSGDLDAGALSVEDAELNADTAGAIQLAVRRAAKVRATGAGDVVISGKPACTVTATGAGQVRCGAAK